MGFPADCRLPSCQRPHSVTYGLRTLPRVHCDRRGYPTRRLWVLLVCFAPTHIVSLHCRAVAPRPVLRAVVSVVMGRGATARWPLGIHARAGLASGQRPGTPDTFSAPTVRRPVQQVLWRSADQSERRRKLGSFLRWVSTRTASWPAVCRARGAALEAGGDGVFYLNTKTVEATLTRWPPRVTLPIRRPPW